MLPKKLSMMMRVSTGPQEGVELLQRCMGLGRSWKERGGQVTLVTGKLPRSLGQKITHREGFQLIELVGIPSDSVDVRGFLHRDGSVLNAVSPEMFSKDSAQYLYQELGCKTAVGMPFKDVATTDSILLRTLPPSTDTDARTAIRRLIEVSMGVIVPAEELEKDPLPNAVALMDLEDAIACDGKVRNKDKIMEFRLCF